MEIDELIKEYIKKAKKLAIIKSSLCGVIFGFALDFILAFILWFVSVGIVALLLLSIGLGLIGGIAAGLLLYFKRFRPTTQTVAQMIDKLGLEERIITMYEMENVDTPIAKLQREDAKKRINSVSPQQFRFKLSRVLVILLAVTVTLGISMTTVSALSTVGALTPGSEITNPEDPSEKDENETEYVEINYLASEGGSIDGETYQRIVKGKDATAVVAVAEEGYTFAEWSDGTMTAERWDWNVMEDLTATAIFLKNKTDSSAGEGEGEGEGEGPGEGEGQGGGETGEGTGEGGGDGDSEGGGESSGDGTGDGHGGESEGDPGDDPVGGSGAGASGQLDDNTVIDGKTDYDKAVDYEKEKENVENDDSLPPELKDALSGYLDGMKP